ncbi:MAG: aldose 1-epimerase family protein [Clostridia bacterium]|nr:aldose 1-epimerase family protein [Clostridiaceae bacterium]
MITLKNKYLSVNINPMGAEVVSIIKNSYEYLWQKNPDIWNGQAPNLFPLIGRLKDEEYEYNNELYKIKIHGFAKVSMFEIIEKNDNYVSLRITGSKDTYSMYPFDFDFIVSYELMDNIIKKQYMTINNGYKTMYYEVGGHEGYNLTFENNKIMDDYYIKFSDSSVYTYTTDSVIMVNKDLKEIDMVDKKLYLKPEVFKNDALILDCSRLKDRNVTLECGNKSRKVKVTFDDFDYLGIWTRPFYSNYVCIEPWSSLPDCNFIDKKLENKIGIRSLLPKKTEVLEYLIEII